MSDLPPPATKPAAREGWFDRLFGWCLEQIVKLIWRVFVKPILMAAFSPVVLLGGLMKVWYPSGVNRRPADDEATNLADKTDGDNAERPVGRDEEGR